MKEKIKFDLIAPKKCNKVLRIMKISALLLFFCLFSIKAENVKSQQTELSLDIKNMTLKKAILEIEKASDYVFLITDEAQLELNKKTSIKAVMESISEILDLLLRDTDLVYTVVERQVTLYKRTSKTVSETTEMKYEETDQQKRTIIGKIIDEQGLPIIGANIVEKGTTNGTITDMDGNFSLNIEEDAVLRVSYIGYTTQDVNTSDKASLQISLYEDMKSLEELVVIGYGVQSKELLSTAISNVDKKVFENIPYSNPAHLLQGTTAGVRVTSTSGQPGSSPLIILRGGTALDTNSSYPLYVIDGIISPNMTGLNSFDIESIQVLKDAASTAIYGARGSNGVILVTTKTGKSGKTKVTFNYDLSFSNYMSRMEMLGAEEFIYYNRMALEAAIRKWPTFSSILDGPFSAGTGNDLTKNTFYTTQYLSPENQHKLNEGWSSIQDPLDPSKTIIFKETNWKDVIFQTGISHNYNISAYGGTDKLTYGVSLGYLDNEGITKNTGYDCISFNTKGDFKVSNNFTINSNVQYSKGLTKGIYDESGFFGRMLQVAPTVKYEFEDGTLAWGASGSKGNPEYKLSVIQQSSSSEKTNYTIGARWDILPNLSFNPKASLLTMLDDYRSFTKANYEGNNYSDARQASESINRYYSRQVDGYFNYNELFFDAHDLKVMLGASFLETGEKSFSATGRGAATDYIPTLNASAIPVSVYSKDSYYRYMGYFTRITYDFKQKYLVSINARCDGASNLGVKYRWGLFPGISIGWNMHRESLLEDFLGFLSKSKLRMSYGINGNTNALGPYLSQGTYGVGGRYADMGVILNSVLENPELKWEEAKTFDIGVDFEFFKKININIDYYRRVTNNLVSTRTLPHETGFGSIITNLGSLENKGFEIELSVQPLSPSLEFKWDFSINAAYVKNKILKLPYNGMENNRIGGIYIWDDKTNDYAWKGGLQEGGTMGEMYGYKQIGLYHSDEEAANAPKDMLVEGEDKDTKFGGDVIWYDADGNNLIDERDRVYLGNEYPKWTGGFLNSFSYKGLSLIIRTDFMLGHTIYNYIRATTTGQFAGDLGLSKEAGKSWLKPGDEEWTNIPKLYYGDYQTNLLRGNSIMFEKGDYLALREVTLSYTIPSKLLKKLFINNLKFNISGHNLYYFTKYKGINPENGGTEYGTYPISANFIFGTTIIF